MTGGTGPVAKVTRVDSLLVEAKGEVLVLTLNRPDKRNALDRPLRIALRTTLDAYDKDPNFRCAVLAANGPSFCAGADLKEMASVQMTIPGEDSFLLLGSRNRLTKPVIAAVDGHARAGGFLLTQATDLCLASPAASFGITEVQRGRGSPWAAPLISMMPKRVMMEMLLTGEPISAERAYELGLVNRVVPSADLLAEAMAMADRIASNAPLSVWAAKQMVEVATEMGESAAERAAHLLYQRVYLSDDAQEGPRAFAEGRQPRWTGR